MKRDRSLLGTSLRSDGESWPSSVISMVAISRPPRLLEHCVSRRGPAAFPIELCNLSMIYYVLSGGIFGNGGNGDRCIQGRGWDGEVCNFRAAPIRNLLSVGRRLCHLPARFLAALLPNSRQRTGYSPDRKAAPSLATEPVRSD
jgi:hypothetical protein